MKLEERGLKFLTLIQSRWNAYWSSTSYRQLPVTVKLKKKTNTNWGSDVIYLDWIISGA